MKRVLLILLFALLAVSLAMATNAYIPSTDVLGAHNNGGRGCAACHAPHSGGRGNGGNIVGTGVSTGGVEGDWHLWGTDVSVITSQTLTFGQGYWAVYFGLPYTVAFGGAQQWLPSSNNLVGGIAVCLSCHDGNVSEGGMMLGTSYEYNNGLLPVGVGAGYAGKPLYGGNASIPTLLGNDGGTPGDYLNDHPVGYDANFNRLNYPQPLQNYGLNFTITAGAATFTVTPGSAYAAFVANYGMPAILAMDADTVNPAPYVVCTTCHNQHQMNVFRSGAGQSQIAGDGGLGTYKTLFFVNAPYNAAAAWGPMAAPSTTQFCRQCHFGVANEAFGQNGIATAF